MSYLMIMMLVSLFPIPILGGILLLEWIKDTEK
jgi:hypothetical protein